MEWFGKPVFHCASDYRVGEGGVFRGGGGVFSIRQAGRRACGQDRHTERGKTRDKGVQFTARDELSFTVRRKAFVIRLWAPLTDLQQSERNENMLFRITLIGFEPPRALCRHMMVYWSPITTQQYRDISICHPAIEFGLVLQRPRPLWMTRLNWCASYMLIAACAINATYSFTCSFPGVIFLSCVWKFKKSFDWCISFILREIQHRFWLFYLSNLRTWRTSLD